MNLPHHVTIARCAEDGHRWVTTAIGGGPSRIIRWQECRDCPERRKDVTEFDPPHDWGEVRW